MGSILDELRQRLDVHFDGRAVPGVRAIVPPPGGSSETTSPFTIVVLDTSPASAGICFNLLEDDEARRRYDGLDLAGLAAGGDALELAGMVLDPDPAVRVVGYATCHALSQVLLGEAREGRLPGAGWRESEDELVARISPDADDCIGLVGLAPPMVRSLLAAGAGRVSVLEREGPARDVTLPAGAAITTDARSLADCTKVLVTSTTMLNGTLDELEKLSRQALFRAVYGPGSSVVPTPLLDRGFDAVAGLVVTDAAALVDRQLAGSKWGDAKRKVLLARS